ncbi:RNA-directed DNA polymerase (Reverse transcriptase) domain containing protein [Elysia marginata]|uniref:RNA-directed DNA polymerase (Reverse transcriptase) domain containing protein n=1 Tax=Elysia marginata TaxID=1093978 RepID=A0AAV4EY08_9GAST|nr:RNA-directed DNA polymerase (Reverse transcriptase) domain containing protein [Elysia marginata]
MGIKALHHLCCQIWKQQEWLEDWKLQEFLMLYKNGNSKECGNYRTIALITHASKILLIIILNRMKCKVEEELSDCQAGTNHETGRYVDDMGINIGGRDITNLRYADDTALLSDNLTSMKRILHRVNNAGQQAGLLLNAKKTKVMHIPASKESSNVEPDIKIEQAWKM